MDRRRNLSRKVYTDISSTTLAHMQAATGLKLSLALYVAVQDLNKQKNQILHTSLTCLFVVQPRH